jgi:hypothetical protein
MSRKGRRNREEVIDGKRERKIGRKNLGRRNKTASKAKWGGGQV